MKNNEDKKHMNELKQKVKTIYDKFPYTINSDNELFFKYLEEEFIGDNEENIRYFELKWIIRNENIKYETISRLGRKLREEFPLEYPRRSDDQHNFFRDYFKKVE